MEAHNALSAKIVEETGFKGIWASGLSMSVAQGVRDNETEDVGYCYYPLDEAMNMISIEHFIERIIRCLNDEDIPSIIKR